MQERLKCFAAAFFAAVLRGFMSMPLRATKERPLYLSLYAYSRSIGPHYGNFSINSHEPLDAKIPCGNAQHHNSH